MIAAIFALILAILAPDAGTDAGLATLPAGYCDPIVVDQTGDPDATGNAGEIAALRGMGWVGDPTDGIEAVYPPECR